MSADDFLEKDLSYKLQGLFIKTSQMYGYQYKEDFYHNALSEIMLISKIKFVSKPHIKIYSLISGKVLSTYIPDFLIEEKIILELKSLSYLNQQSIIQLDQYLKASIYELGYLVNFGEPKANIVRRIYSNTRKPWLK